MDCGNTIDPFLLDVLNPPIDGPELYNPAAPPLHTPNVAKHTGGPAPIEPNVSLLNDEPSLQLHRDSRPNPGTISNDDAGNFDFGMPTAYRADASHNIGDSSFDRSMGGSSRQDLNTIMDPSMDTMTAGSVNWSLTMEPSKKDRQLPQPPATKKQPKPTLPPMLPALELPDEHQSGKYEPVASSIHDNHGWNILNIHFQPQQPELKVRSDLSFNTEHNYSEESTQELTGINTYTTVSSQAPVTVPVVSNDVHSSLNAQENDLEEPSLPPKSAPKPKKKSGPRKPWDEDETFALIRGVGKKGLGDWKNILELPEYKPIFALKCRNTSDLKDRWRTICPPGLQTEPQQRPSSISGDDCSNSLTPTGRRKRTNKTKRKSERITNERFAEISGIEVTNVKGSFRRPNVHFTAEEDTKIFAAWKIYGSDWSKAMNDPRFSNFGHRTPTDLRDRFRNRFKDHWKRHKECKNADLSKEKAGITDNPSKVQPTDEKSTRPERQDAIPNHLPSMDASSFSQTGSSFYQLPSVEAPAFSQAGEWEDSSFWLMNGNPGQMGENVMSGPYTSMDINSIISPEQVPPLHPEQVQCLQDFNNNAAPINENMPAFSGQLSLREIQ
ncbi:uncharacterized protein L3040_005979 [Drepanopeziza brunnea f. sp. 'multigermtubi']|uniref:MYB DNA-binding domain containing protein n=1 Tax=Marssonina brunnea f. sp. multigermtubi (strain MB_m1) TaxID=1072389 RepID=K1XT79_MARBU|nr:MYB DNA-binding domain containing protein [Drepanopeziza brunnea f. sp. 'multigermtubi' MB_m1]EKD15674.1 MYB DNA-binding domain containing protein [Drepanopeziza brunnea f. sp. 'multigermtubi' MB_m1]KAJ5040322.1 hypothetical protein L3040_005979 [Drepanopeziza brunnea f. sp. 'multigermtubi']